MDAIRRKDDTARGPLPLKVTGLKVTRGGRVVIAGLDLALGAGEALLLTGPNGVGKSTLLRCLFGLITRDEGAIDLAGTDEEAAGDLAPHCHYLGHRDALKPAMTVAENLGFWTNLLGGGGMAGDAALDRVGLLGLADLPAAWLSAGQRRRLSIARLLAVHRPVWLLDEPTAALDTAAEATLIGIIEEHRAAGGAVIAATHLPLALKNPRQLAMTPPPPEGAGP